MAGCSCSFANNWSTYEIVTMVTQLVILLVILLIFFEQQEEINRKLRA